MPARAHTGAAPNLRWAGGEGSDPSAFVSVPATADIFAAGLASLPTLPNGVGTPPPSLPVTPGTVVTFSASGQATAHIGVLSYNGPNGAAILGSGSTDINSYGGISGVVDSAAEFFLVGVFTNNLQPEAPAPAPIDFTGPNFTSLSPGLDQVFFIGTGVTSGDVAHSFTVPAGANKLYLGLPDADGFNGSPGYYSDDVGQFSVTVDESSVQDAAQALSPAGGGISPAQAFGGSDPSAPCPCTTPVVAKPAGIAPGDGDLVESSQDISVPGAGVPLALTRTYDSGLAQQEVSTSTPPGPLGYGWSYNLGMTLTSNATTGNAAVHQEDGSQIGFTLYNAGSSPSWCNGATNYCANAPRDLATLQKDSSSWTMTRYAGGGPVTFGFSASGALISETNEAGQSLTASSEAAGAGACPASATSCTVWESSASGRALTLAFDGSGRLVSATDGAGNTVAYCYFGQSCAGAASDGGTKDLYSATPPGGAATTYGYDSSNSSTDLQHDIVSEALPRGASVANTYGSSGQVTSQTSPYGDLTLSYSGNNQSVSGGSTVVSTWPAGTSGSLPAQEVGYQFSSGALVAETTGYGTSSAATQYFDLDPTSLVATTVQDGNGNQTAMTIGGDSTGDPMNAGDVTLSTDLLGNTTAYAYNADNQVWCQVSPAEYENGVFCPSAEPTSPPASGVADPYLGATISLYNTAGELTARTDALGNTTTYAYTSGVAGVPDNLQYCSVDPVHYQASVACPAYGAAHVSGTTTSSFDSAGDQLSATDADGNTTSYVYAVSGHPGLVSSATSPDGTTTTYSYNGAGQVTSQVQTFGSYSATTLYAYDQAGNQYCTVGPGEAADEVTCPSSPPPSPPTPSDDPYLGATITTFDGAGRPVQVANPLGEISYTAYDEAGNAYCTVAPAAAATGVTCPSSPPSSAPTTGDDPYPGATITTYDTVGRPVQVTNPLGGITLTQYDADNNVTQATVESNNSTADPNVVTTYGYDADDQVTSTTVDLGGRRRLHHRAGLRPRRQRLLYGPG